MQKQNHQFYAEDTQTLIGTQKKRLQDLDTGEILEVDQITKRALGQKQFWKIFLMDFLQVLGILDSRQVDILVYIMENTLAANNMFIGTYAKIRDDVGVSQATVARVMRKLQEKGFLKRIQNGLWQVSPKVMMKGNDHKKQLLLSYYDDLDNEKDKIDLPPKSKEEKKKDDTRTASTSKAS